MKKIIAIIGARPQFIKHYPFEKEAVKYFQLKTIHTGQHYDENMSQIFFDELGMRKPDFLLSLGGGSHGVQTGRMMIEIERIVLEEKPDGIVVYGDTNSTLAGALVASKLHIKLIHIEAGLRSYNKKMPEEINRVLTDYMSDLLFVPSEMAVSNLEKENLKNNIVVVGDIMKDLVLLAIMEQLLNEEIDISSYYYATIHRPYNTDKEERLINILEALNNLDKKTVFAIHPRTRNAMKCFGLKEDSYSNIIFIDPQSYFSNLSYLKKSSALITDSGGMQKEAYWLKKKCITVRSETEWMETLENGWNHLIFDNLDELANTIKIKPKVHLENLYGEGKTSQLMVRKMCELFK